MTDSYDNLECMALNHLIEMNYEFRTFDGSCNNVKNPSYGKSNKPFLRKVPALYNNLDGCSLNDLNGDRPNPRDVSNTLFSQTTSCPNSKCLSNIFWLWGQFINNTIIMTATTDECKNIEVDSTDILAPYIPFKRSESIPNSENCDCDNPRQQINRLSPFIDVSSIYGDTPARNACVREFCGGRLKMDCEGLPPLNNLTTKNNENIGLLSLHVLFVREHNYWAYQICKACPNMCDDQIYQRAKLMVESEIQAITYNEYLPLLLGECLPCYVYDCNTNPQPTNVFSVAASRFMYSMMPSCLLNGVRLRELFYASNLIENRTATVDGVLTQFACGVAEEMDSKVVDDLRNYLYSTTSSSSSSQNQCYTDIVSLTIQRGRDHGLGLLNDYLVACCLLPITKFCEITSDCAIQAKLASLYAKPGDIDIWVYGLVKAGHQSANSCAVVDPLFKAIIKDTFLRVRNGDRLWYECRLSSTQTNLVNCTRLSRIIRRNTCCGSVANDVFKVNPYNCCDNYNSNSNSNPNPNSKYDPCNCNDHPITNVTPTNPPCKQSKNTATCQKCLPCCGTQSHNACHSCLNPHKVECCCDCVSACKTKPKKKCKKVCKIISTACDHNCGVMITQ